MPRTRRDEFIPGDYWRPDNIDVSDDEVGLDAPPPTPSDADRLVEFSREPISKSKVSFQQPAVLAILLVLSFGATLGFTLLAKPSEERRPSWALYIATAALGGVLGWRT